MQTKTRPFAGDGSTFEELIEVLMAMPGTQSDELARNEEQLQPKTYVFDVFDCATSTDFGGVRYHYSRRSEVLRMRKVKWGTETTIVMRSQFEFGAFCRRRRARLVLSGSTQNVLQSQKIGLSDQHPGLAVSEARLGPVSRKHGQRFYVELEAEAGDACLSPKPHRGLTDAPDDLRGLENVEVTLAVTVDIGRELLHRGTERNFQDESNRIRPVRVEAVKQHPDSQADGFAD